MKKLSKWSTETSYWWQ